MVDDVLCPYCKVGQEIKDDPDGYQEETVYNQRCLDCGKIFIYTIVFNYITHVANCKNDGKHKWEDLLEPVWSDFDKVTKQQEIIGSTFQGWQHCNVCKETRRINVKETN